ncbi:recombinase family protein [Methylophilus sp. 13]|uniref:recombinase family protein n=1 Tax=Methylophilus sp. 13 TaxID=2781018 RepID=UPI00188F81D1|nr:recombinase family protein [Methylophilus sp. 13]MBF5038916.1 recombinase family protein [Methylophilus sp. 13]
MSEHKGVIIGYGRVSTEDQTCDNQRMTIEAKYKDVRWYQDAAVSGTVPALERPSLATIMKFADKNDTLVVTAIDRLGRNTIDVLTTVEAFKKKGVKVISLREHFDLSTPFGEFMLTMLAGLSKLERENIRERQLAGIKRARAEGKNLGKVKTIVDSQVAQWRADNNASIAETAKHFGISLSSVKRACNNSLV